MIRRAGQGVAALVRWWWHRPTLVLLALIVGVYWLTFTSVQDANDKTKEVAVAAREAGARAEKAIELLREQRDEARVNACVEARVTAVTQNAQAIDFATAHNNLVLYLTHVPGRPAPDQEIAAAFESANIVTARSIPVRNCDPKSIAEFYDDKVTAGDTTEAVPLRGIVGG